MTSLVPAAIDVLRHAGVCLDPGLTDTEIERVEGELDFRFGPEHRELLQTTFPVGDGWIPVAPRCASNRATADDKSAVQHTASVEDFFESASVVYALDAAVVLVEHRPPSVEQALTALLAES